MKKREDEEEFPAVSILYFLSSAKWTQDLLSRSFPCSLSLSLSLDVLLSPVSGVLSLSLPPYHVIRVRNQIDPARGFVLPTPELRGCHDSANQGVADVAEGKGGVREDKANDTAK